MLHEALRPQYTGNIAMIEGKKSLRILSIDGGGMRGVYSSTYLSVLAKELAKRRKINNLDVGKAFDLIVGTSSGGILACALAAGIPLDEVSGLYSKHGREIFPMKMPNGVNIFNLIKILYRWQVCNWSKSLARGNQALKQVLEKKFADMTLRQVYNDRGIALAIPAIEMSQHRSWVFKTPHLGGHRDDDFRLVDMCLATSAAPLYRSMARVENPTTPEHNYVFVDGGLWANNPILVGMIDAIRMTKPGDRIEIFSLGTCPRPPGNAFDAEDMHRGPLGWKFGAEVVMTALDAQRFAYDNMADMLAEHLNRDCAIVHFPQGDLPAESMPYLDLDETDEKATQMLINQAQNDVFLALSAYDRPTDNNSYLLVELFKDIPPVTKQEKTE